MKGDEIMKRIVLRMLLLCILLSLPFVLLSCAQTEGEALLGRWETEMEDEELGKFTIVYHFTEDGEIFVEQKQGDAIPFSIPFGTWSVKGSEVTIKSDGTEKTFSFSIQGSELTLSGEGEETLVFQRI